MSKKRMGGLRLVWLEAFVAAADHGSFSSAAVSLGCNQSSVTRHVADLALWLGYDLFTKAVPLELSVEGETFIGVAKEVIALLAVSRSEQRLTREAVPR